MKYLNSLSMYTLYLVIFLSEELSAEHLDGDATLHIYIGQP
jgi:hypothetical protein